MKYFCGSFVAHRWAVAALAVVVLCSCKGELYARVSERDANDILATLYAAGIAAYKSTRDEKSWSVEVSQQDLQRALQVVGEHGLPREQFSNTGELFKKEGLISTPSEERIRFIYAISQELAHTLSEIDGVVSARVHPVIPANDPLASHIRPSSASIFIKHRRDADLQAMAPAIKNLVMRSIEGLEYENISLTFVATEEPGAHEAAPVPVAARGPVKAVVGGLAMSLLFVLGALGYVWNRYGPALTPAKGATPVKGAGTREASRPMQWLAQLESGWSRLVERLLAFMRPRATGPEHESHRRGAASREAL